MATRSEPATRFEAVPFQTGLHPVSCGSALGLAAFIGFVGTLIIRHNDLTPGTDLRVVLITVALGAAVLMGPLLRLRRSALTVTRDHLRLRLASWRDHTAEIPLAELRAVDVRTGAIGSRLDYGTVTVARGEETVIIVHHVRAPLALRDALQRAAGRR